MVPGQRHDLVAVELKQGIIDDDECTGPPLNER